LLPKLALQMAPCRANVEPMNTLRNTVRHVVSVIALVFWAHGSMASPRDLHATNARPELALRVEDYQLALGETAPSTAPGKVMFDQTTEGANDATSPYVFVGVQAMAFPEGGVTLSTMLVILPAGEDAQSRRGEFVAGFIAGIHRNEGAEVRLAPPPTDGLPSSSDLDFEVFFDKVPFGRAAVRGRGRNLVIVSVLGRHVLPDAPSLQKLLDRKLEGLLAFVPEFETKTPAAK
jgi:hypothetical protein